MFMQLMQNDFNQGLQIVQRAISTKSTMPILTGIYLEAKHDEGLHLISNDLELGIECWVKADIKEEGAIVLPGSNLTSIVRELPPADINFNANMENYEIEFKCLNSEFKLKGYPPDEFPQLPEVENAQVLGLNATKFRNLLEEVKFSTSIDQTQPALTGGLMVITRKGIKMVTTNTYRLAYSSREIENEIETEIKVIIPGNTINELASLIDETDKEEEIELHISKNYVRFNYKNIVLISRLIDGEFPNYQQVIPKTSQTRLKVDRVELLKAVRRASYIAREDSNIISISINKDTMNIYAVGSVSGDAHESLEIELEGSDQEVDIDAGYLLDVLKFLKDEVIIMEAIGQINPLTIRKDGDDSFIYLIMPVRPGS
jgi:DNA polymerase III subunit beta